MTEQSETIGALAGALAKVQAALQPVIKDKTAKIPTKSGGSYSYRYADLGSIWDACRAPLTKNGLAIVQIPEQADAGSIALRTTLIHESGEWISGSVALRLADVTPQALGSALTYLRRYALAAVVGIVADEDDDGQTAANQPPQPRQQPQRPPTPTETNGNSERAAIVSKYRQTVIEAREKGIEIVGVKTGDLTNEQIKSATDEARRLMNAKIGGIPIGEAAN